MSLADLAQRALLGTERGAAAIVDADLAALARADDAALTLLRQAAWAAVRERAGRLPVVASAAAVDDCPAEQLAAIGDSSVVLLLEILTREDAALTRECLTRIRAQGRRLDERLLPRLLDESRDPHQRAEIVATGGEIARWLVQLNPAWSLPVATDDDGVWQAGTLAQRVIWLAALRQRDAAAALALLSEAFANEAPAARGELLATLAINLSAADEPFLESVLDDRRKEVRRAAAALLQRLPLSRLCERAFALAQPALTVNPGGWLRKASLEIQLPEACTAAMQRDGIDAKPPAGYAGGERSYWLEELLARVPLQRWTSAFTMDAATLWSLTRKHEFAVPLRRGWLRAAISGAAMDWLDLALADGALANEHGELAQQLAACVGKAADAEQRVAAQLESRPDEQPDLLLIALPAPWSPRFSQQALSWLRLRWRALAPKGREYLLQSALKTAAHALDPTLAIDESGWHGGDGQLPRALSEFFAVHALRRQFLTSLQRAP